MLAAMTRTTPPHRAVLTAAALLLPLLAPTLAHAAEGPSSTGKRFRLHADTEFFGFSSFNPDADGADNINGLGFGIGRLAFPEGPVSASYIIPQVGLGFGYLFPNQQAMVGGRFSLVVQGANLDEDTTLFGMQLVPYFRWLFLPGGQFRPYVEARLGFAAGSLTDRNEELGVEVTTRVSTIGPVVGAGGGVQIFLTDYFSLDAGLNFDYGAPFSKLTAEGDGGSVEGDREKDGDLINLGIMAGFSVWFG
jgi:hypothetical protein